ncbi:unnamed protein product [Withania somnifera]
MLELDIDDDSPQPIMKQSVSTIDDDDSPQPIKKKFKLNSLSSSKNQTKLIKSTIGSSQNQTKLIKSTTGSSKNQTKLTKISSSPPSFGFGSINDQTKLAKTKLSGSTKNKTKLIKTTPEEKFVVKSHFKKVNFTSTKSLNSTKTTSPAAKKSSSDLSKIISSLPKNKTTKLTTNKDLNESKSKSKNQSSKNKNTKKETTGPYWLENDEDDLISGLTDLPSKFQQTLLPDLEKISKTSKVYLNKANKEITKNFKGIVGNKYAPTIASLISFAFILIPLILVSLIFNKIKAYFSLQRLLIFIQVYLSIYFSILCLSSLITGLEPLKFFYATSQSTYICLQLLQILAYVLYLLMLLMYLVLVLSTRTGRITKMIGLTQTFVGFAIGLHYYMTVFHKAVLRQPPKTSWRIHAIYAICFLMICLLTRAERTKRTYLEEGGEEGKES